MCDRCDKTLAALQNTYDICVGWLEEFTCEYDEEYKAALEADIEYLPTMLGQNAIVDKVIAARLEGIPVPPVIAHEILANLDMDLEDFANLYKNDGELKTVGVVARNVGHNELADKAFCAVYST